MIVVATSALLLLLLLSQTAAQSSCDPLVPEYCMMPWPNNFYMAIDPTTPTGLRIRLDPAALPISDAGELIDPSAWLDLDGFSVFTSISVIFPNVSIAESDGVPAHWDPSPSLAESAPVALLDTVTGERLPYFMELDVSSGYDVPTERQALLVWPLATFEFNRRYVVGYRNLVNKLTRQPIVPSPAFRALRDNTTTDDEDVEQRRAAYETRIFPELEAVGWQRSSLQLAFEFTTGSRSSIQGRLDHALADALPRIPAEGPEYEVLSVIDNGSADTARQITGRFSLPMYTETPLPGSTLVLDENDLPVYQGEMMAFFTVTIPQSVATGQQEPQGLLHFGHGLFQNHLVVLTPEIQHAANVDGVVCFAHDWIGMSVQDVGAITEMLYNDLSDANMIPDRCLQGMLAAVVLQKMVSGSRFQSDPLVFFNNRSTINANDQSYLGYSLGGISGTTYAAISPALNSFILGVPGTSFALMLPRATPFIPYWEIISLRYSDPADRNMILTYMQLLWDRTDSSGWARSLGEQTDKKVQVVHAIGDNQVSWLAAYALGRSIGCKAFPNYATARTNETRIYGIELETRSVVPVAEQPCMLIGYDFHTAEVTIYNTFWRLDDTHNWVYMQQSFVERWHRMYYDQVHDHNCYDNGVPVVCSFDPTN